MTTIWIILILMVLVTFGLAALFSIWAGPKNDVRWFFFAGLVSLITILIPLCDKKGCAKVISKLLICLAGLSLIGLIFHLVGLTEKSLVVDTITGWPSIVSTFVFFAASFPAFTAADESVFYGSGYTDCPLPDLN